MDKKGWQLLQIGKDAEAEAHNQFPFVVALVSRTIPTSYFGVERFATKKEAMARATYLNEDGERNVIVFEEAAFCIRKEPK